MLHNINIVKKTVADIVESTRALHEFRDELPKITSVKVVRQLLRFTCRFSHKLQCKFWLAVPTAKFFFPWRRAEAGPSF